MVFSLANLMRYLVPAIRTSDTGISEIVDVRTWYQNPKTRIGQDRGNGLVMVWTRCQWLRPGSTPVAVTEVAGNVANIVIVGVRHCQLQVHNALTRAGSQTLCT